MCRRLLLLLSLMLSFASVGAQTQTVTLSGQLRSGTEPVAGAVLALLQPSDSSLLTYTISDSEGRYRLQLETSLPTSRPSPRRLTSTSSTKSASCVKSS